MLRVTWARGQRERGVQLQLQFAAATFDLPGHSLHHEAFVGLVAGDGYGALSDRRKQWFHGLAVAADDDAVVEG
jgi:hypothetical protein